MTCGVSALVLISISGLQAQSTSWTAATGDWNTAGNWDNGVPAAGSNVFMDNNGTAQLTATGVASYLNLGNTGAGTLEISGNGALTVGTTGFIGNTGVGTLSITGSGASANFVNSGGLVYTLVTGNSGTGTANLSAGGTLTLQNGTGTMLLGNGTGGSLNIGTGGAAGVLNAGTVRTGSNGIVNFNHTDANYSFTTNGGSSGTGIVITSLGRVTHNGSGMTTLTAANSYIGGTAINAGTLVGASSTAFGSGGVTVANGATRGIQGNVSQDNTSTIAGSGASGRSGAIDNISGSNTLSGLLAQSAAATIGSTAGILTLSGGIASGGFTTTFNTLSGSTITESGGISGTRALVKSGGGTLTLSGNNTYQGGTTVAGGTLSLGSNTAAGTGTITTTGSVIDYVNGVSIANAININSNTTQLQVLTGSATQAGVISQTGGARPLEKIGTGTLTLSGVNTYSGGTTLSAGTLAVSQDNNLGNAAGALTFNGGTLQTTGTFTMGRNTTLNAGGGTFNTDTGTTMTQNAVISGAGGLTKTGAGTLVLSNTNSYGGSTTISAGTLELNQGSVTGNIVNNAALRIFNSGTTTISNVISGTGSVVMDGDNNSGFFTITGANSYGGGTSLDKGYFIISDDGNLGAASGSLSLNNVFLETGVASYTMNRTTTLSGTNVIVNSGSTVLTLAGDISGSGSLNRQNGGTIVLTGTNNYGGGTGIFNGTLRIGNGGSTGSITGNVTVNASTSNLVFNRSNSFSLAGNITGNGRVTQEGGGTTFLSGTNTYAAGTFLNGGKLSVSSNANLGAAAGTLTFNGGYLQTTGTFTMNRGTTLNTLGVFEVNTGTTLTQQGVISGAGALTKTDGGILVLSGNNTYGGGTTVAGGTLSLASNTAAGTGTITTTGSVIDYVNGVSIANPININSNTTQLQVLTGSAIQSGVISETAGPRPLEKIGAGTLILTAANTYTGTTTISAGTLQIGNDGTTGSVAGNIVNNSVLNFNRSNNVTYGGVISGSGSVNANTAGEILKLTGNNTFSGNLTLNNGATVFLGAGGTSGGVTGNVVVNSGTLYLDRSDDVVYDGVISGNTNVIKGVSASGKFTFTQAQTFVGAMIINRGTIALTGAGSLAANESVSVGGSATFDISGGGNQTIKNLTGDTGGKILLGANTLTFGTADDRQFDGVISGTGGITKQGSGVAILAGANTFTGLTTVNAGKIQVGNAGSTGSLTGDVFVNGVGTTLDFNRDNALSYGGIISGTGKVTQSGTGITTLTGNNTYSGGTTVAGGTLSLGSNTAAGTGTITTTGSVIDYVDGVNIANAINIDSDTTQLQVLSGSAAQAGVISETAGPRPLEKIGTGTLVLTGSNTYTGPTTITAGTLLANNASGSATGTGEVTVALGTTLGGSGSITGNVVVQDGGVLAPGAIGGGTETLSLGSLVMNYGSTLRLNINGTAVGTGYDQLNVTGTASLGGTLDLVFGSFVPTAGSSFTLLTSGGLGGSTFADVTSDLGAALTLTVTYDTNNVGMDITLTQEEFAQFAGTPNQQAVAGNLDTFSTSGKYQKLIDKLNMLDAGELKAAFDAIAPEELGAMSSFGFSNTRNVFNMLSNRVNEIQNGQQFSSNGLTLWDNSKEFKQDLFAGTDMVAGGQLYVPKVDDKRLGFFVSGQGTFGDVDGDGTGDDYDFSTGGMLLGSDYRLTENIAVGAYAGYQGTQSNTSTGSEIASDSAKFGVYGTYFSGKGSWLSANIGGGYHSYDSDRNTVGGVASGSTNGTEINAQLTYGYDFKAGANKEWTFGPEVSAGYTHLWIDGFGESGSAAPLQIQDQSNDSLRSTLSWKVSYDWKLNSGAWTLRPYARIGWQHEFMDDSQSITARFAGAGNAFTVNSSDQDPDSVIAGAGAQMLFSETISAQLGYSAEANGQYDIHSVNGSLNFRF